MTFDKEADSFDNSTFLAAAECYASLVSEFHRQQQNERAGVTFGQTEVYQEKGVEMMGCREKRPAVGILGQIMIDFILF